MTTTSPERASRRVKGHRISWFVYAGPTSDGRLVKLPKTATMRGHWPGYDAECECGWASHTGGAIKASVERDVRDHKYDVTGDWRMM